MSIRLNKALRELNIGLQTAVEFLENKKELGEVKAEPSFKISDEQYQALNDAFSKDKEVRDQAEKLFTKKTKDKKRAPEQKDNRSENVLESGRQQYKPLGKIDLDSLGKKSAVQSVADKPEVHEQETAAVSPAPNKEIVKAENKDEKRQQNVSQHKQNMKQENQQKTQQAKSHESKGLQNANNIPEIIKYLNENLIAAAYIIHEPAEYWAQKREDIMAIHPEWDDAKIYNEMELLKDQITKQIADVMAGRKNVGKFFTCIDFVDPDGNKMEWKIEPIEMNVDKYIEAQTKISRIADSSTTSGFGLNPALANIIIDGKGDSGSQMLYALKIFYGADTQIPEEIALEAINDAIRINFPNKKGVFMGIYRKVINKEDNVTAAKRATNQA